MSGCQGSAGLRCWWLGPQPLSTSKFLAGAAQAAFIIDRAHLQLNCLSVTSSSEARVGGLRFQSVIPQPGCRHHVACQLSAHCSGLVVPNARQLCVPSLDAVAARCLPATAAAADDLSQASSKWVHEEGVKQGLKSSCTCCRYLTPMRAEWDPKDPYERMIVVGR